MKNKHNIFYTSPHTLARISESAPVLIAFSGGADSSALLHLMNEESKSQGFNLCAAHYNHGIRGDEADRDAEFCQQICKKLGIPFFLEKANVPALAKESGNSIESEAREQRYAFFERIMRENEIPILVTAHHAEDQIESILLHILRGSGISGLKGMAECRPFANDFYLVRPLLHTEKEDILCFCAENNIDFVTDSTNSDINYARNFIRTDITPKMRELQPNLSGVFDRISESADEANDLINKSAEDFIESKCKNSIPLSKFDELHIAIKKRVLILCFEEYSNGASLENTHIKSIIELCKKAGPHSSVSLPGNIAARIEDGALLFTEDKTVSHDEEFCIPFSKGKTELENGVVINIEKNPKEKPQNFAIFLDVRCDIINENTAFRSKKEGDVIFSGKMNKKVKKLVSEKKIPLNLRSKLPYLVCENEILWVPAVATCDRLRRDKINENTDFYRITVDF